MNLKKLYKKYKHNKLYYSYGKYLLDDIIDDKMVLLDSKQGRDLNGNMFYIAKELNNTNYKVYISVLKDFYDEFKKKLDYYNLNNCKLVLCDTKKYYKVIGHAKYLFSDTSFKQFFRKKEGQVYFNTWHGTPFKNMGRSSNFGYEAIGNVQRNLMMSDYILFPSNYMKDLMTRDYMLNNIGNNIKCFMSGYPRNEIFYDEKRRNKLRKELKLSNKEVIMYMPTYRDDNDSDIFEKYLNEISSKLNDNQIMYVNFHPLVKDKIKLDNYKNIRPFDTKYETYDFLNMADVLITDYSSVFFDFAITKRKIILFTMDEEEYFKTRGTYFDINELPFKKVNNVEDLVKEINSNKKVNTTSFLKKYCSLECKDATKKITNYIFNNKEEIKIESLKTNKKKNALVFVKNFKSDKFDSFVDKYKNEYNIYLTYYTGDIKESKNVLKQMDDNIYYYPTYKKNYGSLKEKVYLYLNSKGVIKKSKTLKQYYNNEFIRRYGNVKIDVIVMLDKNKRFEKMMNEIDCEKQM